MRHGQRVHLGRRDALLQHSAHRSRAVAQPLPPGDVQKAALSLIEGLRAEVARARVQQTAN